MGKRHASYACTLEFVQRTQRRRGGEGGSNIRIGLSLTKGALQQIGSKISHGSPCQNDLAALSSKASRPVNIQTITAQANASAGYVYDGATSNTVWNDSTMGDTISGNKNKYPGWTVGDEFNSESSIVAVSQTNGNAIWVNSSYVADVFTSSTNPSLLGLMKHEALHKFGLNDAQMEVALGIPANSPSQDISNKLTTDCFLGH